MAGATKQTPQERIDALEQQQVKLAVQRSETELEMRAAYGLLELRERGENTAGPGTLHPPPAGQSTLPERRKAAEEAQALGREGETLEAIAAEEQAAQQVLAAGRPRLAALDGAVATLRGEVEEIEDREIAWFARRADALSQAAVEAHADALQVMNAAYQARREAKGAWSRVRFARQRLGWPPLPEVPVDDLPSAIGGFEASGRWEPWPRGVRPSEAELAATWSPEEWQTPVREAA